MKKTIEILTEKKKRFDELDSLICAPEIIADNRYWLRLNNEREGLKRFSDIYDEIIMLLDEYEHTKDETLSELINQSLSKADEIILEKTKDGDDCIIEIRPENKSDAAFCLDLVKMYENYFSFCGFIYKKISQYSLGARGAYETVKNENGIHKYDGGGALVLVFKSIERECAEISEGDIRTDLFHSSGAGGQNVNKVQSAVRLTHMPTNIVVVCQDSRSQLMNKEAAMKTLKNKLEEFYKNKNTLENERLRKAALKGAKEKIRLYSYGQNIVSDSKSGLSLPLKQVFGGQIDPFIKSALLKEGL